MEYKYKADGDAWDYIHLGLSVAKTGKYGHLDAPRNELLIDFKNNSLKNKKYNLVGETAFRPPVWPFIIAGVFFLFGYNLTFVLIVKFLLHLAGMWIFHKTLRILKLPELFIILGVFLYGINPAWQLYSRVFLSEPATLFLITVWLYFLLKYIIENKNFFTQAIIGGVLILAHPYYIFLPFSIWLLLLIENKIKWKSFILSSVICISVVSIWVIRNSIVLDTPQMILTTSSGAVIAKGWNPEVSQEHTNTKGDLADEELVLKEFPANEKISALNEVQRMKLFKDASIHYIKNHPHEIIPIIVAKLKSAFNPLPETPRPGFLETGRVTFQILSFLAILYIIFFSKSSLFRSLAIGLVISTLGITIIIYSGFRFRMPQSGIEILFIIFMLDKFYRSSTGKKKKLDYK